jgi:tripartite-type tricarboxylate transporter receptor subunit TctC
VALAGDGKVKLLAVTNPARTPIVSEVQTAQEQGFDELTFEGSLGLFGPASMAKATATKVAETMLAVSREENLATVLRRVGLTPKAESGDALLSRLDGQVRHWRKVIEVTGFKLPG